MKKIFFLLLTVMSVAGTQAQITNRTGGSLHSFNDALATRPHLSENRACTPIPTVNGIAVNPQIKVLPNRDFIKVNRQHSNGGNFTEAGCNDIIVDGSFENGGIPSTTWPTQSSTNFGTPLCDNASCGTGGGASPPRTGLIWAWFGGVSGAETATLGQSVVIPTGTATLTYWMRIGTVTTPFNDVFTVKVDGTVVQSFTEPAVAEAAYTQRSVNLNAYANGAAHTILFTYTHTGTGISSFVVDDVQLNSCTVSNADLAITKTDGVTSYTPGGTTTYTIVASNPTGPDAITGATVTDNFPAAITSVNWTAAYAGGASGPASGTGNISATVNLPIGGTATFTAVANISSSATGNLSNTATIASPSGGTDPTPGNNSATDTDTQGAPPACGWLASIVYPVPVLDAPAVSVGSNLYVFAGVSNSAVISASNKFDGTTWTSIAALPTAVEYPSAVSDGTNIYIMGGALTGTGVPQTTNYRYNVATNTYTTLAPFTTATWNHCAVYLGGKIYKFGGTNATPASVANLEIYDISANTWSTGAALPVAASFVGCFTQGGYIYAVGGLDAATTTASLKTYRYDPVANSWNDAAIADLPATRWASAGGLYNSLGLMAGGYVGGTAAANLSNTAIAWAPTTNSWSTVTIPNMIGERARMGGAVIGNSFYVIGGRSTASASFVGTNDNQKLTQSYATISYAGSPYCSNAGTATVTQAGTTGGTYTSTAGLTINATTGDITLGTSTPGTYTITYTTTGCIYSATATVTITAAPSATISYAGSPYCSSAGTANVTQTGTTGGAYSSAAGLSLNTTTGAVTLGTSTAGTYTVTYTVAASGGCAVFTTTASITVTAAPGATISYAGSPYCSNAGTANVTRTGTTGGTYSSTAGLSLNTSTGAVTLSTSTPGTYTVTYTVAAANGCAAFTTTASITINAAPSATIAYGGSPYCTSGGTASVTQTGTGGGAYSSSAGLSLNTTTGTITLGTSTAGTYTVTYTIAAAGGCAVYTTTASVTINAGPSATIAYAGSPYCTTGGTANVTQTGSAGGTYSSTAGLSLNTTTGAVTPGTSTAGTYTVTYTIAAAGGCAAFTTTASITVSVCTPGTCIENFDGVTVPAFPTGWSAATLTSCGTSAPWVTSNAASSTAPNSAFTNDPPCISDEALLSKTYNITGNPTMLSFMNSYNLETSAVTPATAFDGLVLEVSINGGAFADIVTAGGSFISNGYNKTISSSFSNPLGGRNAWSGNSGGFINTTAMLPASAAGQPVVFRWRRATDNSNIYVVTGANIDDVYVIETATISYAGSPYCSNAGTASPTLTGSGSGTYSSTAGLSINPSTGVITLGTSTPGTYTVTYIISQGAGCPTYTTTASVTINAGPAATISYAGSPYCSNAGTASVTQTGTTGGTYSSTAGLSLNTTTGDITLGTSTAGTYTVTYAIAAAAPCAAYSTTASVTITAAPSATISYTGSPYCSNAGTANVTQTGTTGGTYSSTAGLSLNTTTGSVTLGTGTAGTYTVTYTVAAANGCAAFTTTASITVTAAPSATISYAGSPYCSNAGTANVTRTGTAGGTYTSTAGLSLNATTGAVTLGTSTAGTYTVTYTVAAAGGCAAFTTTATITITAAPNATISYAGSPYCSSAGTASVTQTGTAGGTYSSTAGLSLNTTTGAVTLSTSTAGTYTVTYTVAAAGGCAVFTTTASITVTAAPSATISYAGSPYCSNAGTANVTRTGTAGGTYTSTAGLTLNASTGAVTLGTSTAGTYTVTYTVAASGGCAVFTTTATITISAAPSATISYTGSPYCSSAGTANVTQTGTAGGTYSSTAGLTLNTTTGAVTLGTSTPGTYTVTYTVAASGGCAVFTTTASITVTAAPNATIAYAGSPYCSNAGTATVTQTGTAGGTYTSTTGLSINGTTGAVTLATSTAGTYIVTYTVAAAGGCAAFTTTASITITAAANATITYAGSPYCTGNGTVNVTRTGTAGGTYSSTAGLTLNATTGAIDLNTSNGGTYTVTYTIAANGGCSVYTTTASVTINITSVAPTSATASNPNICGPSGTTNLTVTGGTPGTGASYKWYSGSCGGTFIGTGATLSNVLVNSTTTFYVRIEGACNNTSCVSVTVNVNPQPVVVLTVSSGGPTPTITNPHLPSGLFATVSPAGSYIYSWTRNGVALPAVTGPSITQANGLLNDFGTYAVTVTAVPSGCFALSNSITLTDIPGERNTLFISPNPTTGMVSVHFYSSTAGAQARTISVFTESGQRIINQAYNITGIYGNMQLDLSRYPAGTYMVVLMDASNKKLASAGVVKF